MDWQAKSGNLWKTLVPLYLTHELQLLRDQSPVSEGGKTSQSKNETDESCFSNYFVFTITYCTGSRNTKSDALSHQYDASLQYAFSLALEEAVLQTQQTDSDPFCAQVLHWHHYVLSVKH